MWQCGLEHVRKQEVSCTKHGRTGFFSGNEVIESHFCRTGLYDVFVTVNANRYIGYAPCHWFRRPGSHMSPYGHSRDSLFSIRMWRLSGSETVCGQRPTSLRAYDVLLLSTTPECYWIADASLDASLETMHCCVKSHQASCTGETRIGPILCTCLGRWRRLFYTAGRD